MARTSKLLRPDTVLKNYWRDNNRFADFFNAVLFDGKAIIQPDELEDMNTEESSVLRHRKYAESIEASRDNIKVRKKSSALGTEFVMLGKESQSHIHYAMPLRVMGYVSWIKACLGIEHARKPYNTIKNIRRTNL